MLVNSAALAIAVDLVASRQGSELDHEHAGELRRAHESPPTWDRSVSSARPRSRRSARPHERFAHRA